MKKTLIIIAVIFISLAILPFVGNKVVQESIQSRLNTLNKYGLTSKLEEQEKKYLTTHMRYHIIVEDEKKFVQYLQQFSSKQLPPYTQSLLEGVTFAIDLDYSNIPFSDKLSIELYPIALSEKTMQNLQTTQPKVYDFVKRVLQNKALLYHIDYNVVSAEFEGYMKDFNEKLTLEKNEHIEVSFHGLKADGKGILLAPDRLHTSLKDFKIDMSANKETALLKANNITSTTNFESETTYISSVHVGELALSMSADNTILQAKVENFALNASSNTQDEKAKLFLKTHLKHFEFNNYTGQYTLDGFNYDLMVEDMHKASYIQLHKLFETRSKEWNGEKEQLAQQNIVQLLAHGLHLKIADLSLKKFSFPNSDEIEGFRANVDLRMSPDASVVDAQHLTSQKMLKNLTLSSSMVISKPFYSVINNVYPVDLILAEYKKEKKDKIIFDIQLKDGVVHVNGKKVE
jgi:hypothetical protein